jgi:acetyl-CoA carboxylase biotin carboxyl carrier protein
MTIDELKQILDMVRAHELLEFELEQEGVRLRVRKDSLHAPVAMTPVVAPAAMTATAPAAASSLTPVAVAPSSPAAVEADGELEEAVELAVVKSPIVGTFYRASAPGSPSFVEIGTTVRKKQVLCIIEAMKLMNEIESEYDGDIVKIYVENGQPVQYGERLFAIREK